MKHLITCLAFILAASTVQADIFGFESVTTNSSYRGDVADQLFMDTSILGVGQSSVEFNNTGDLDSTITEIYFGSPDTALNLSIDSLISCSPGVVFSLEQVTPSDPPASSGFGTWWYITLDAAGAVPPPAINGIDPFECLILEISYNGSLSFSELIQYNQVQVALHVTGQPDEESDTFVNNTYIVPEPASLLLIGSAGVLIGFVRRRFII